MVQMCLQHTDGLLVLQADSGPTLLHANRRRLPEAYSAAHYHVWSDDARRHGLLMSFPKTALPYLLETSCNLQHCT